MKKTLIVCLALIMILTGCSKKDKDSGKDGGKPEPQKVVQKLDTTKPYVYSEIKDKYNQEQSISDFMKNSSYFTKDSISKEPYIDDLHNITLNFETESSKKVQDEINKEIESLEKEQKEYQNMRGTFALINYAESDNTISFMTYKGIYPTVPADVGMYTIKSYVFSKTDGKLLNNKEVLDLAKVTNDDIYDQMTKKLKPIEPEYNKNEVDYKIAFDSCDATKYEKCISIGTSESLYINESGKLSVLLTYRYLTQNALDPDAVYYIILQMD
ncbi:MAG: hypothetical protein RR565_05760 [Erysipelothrix sp.]